MFYHPCYILKIANEGLISNIFFMFYSSNFFLWHLLYLKKLNILERPFQKVTLILILKTFLRLCMNEKNLKKIALLPSVITAFGLSCGLFVIFKMNMIGSGEADFQVLTSITGILLLAAFADLLDGAVARAIKAESYFGGIFDSLADAISFGVAPSVIILKSLSVSPGTQLSFSITTAALIFSICGVLRLVRFSVHAMKLKVMKI